MKNVVQAVGVVFENDKGEILVLKRHPAILEGATWGLVGGSVEEGEDEGTAAQREVEEEIGCSLHPERLKHIKTYHWDRPDFELEFTAFHCFMPIEEARSLVINPDEHTASLWERPSALYQRQDLMIGLYPILEDLYQVR